MLHRPLQFVDLTKLKTEKSHQAFHPSNDTGVQTNASYEEARSVALLKGSTVILFRRKKTLETERWKKTSSRTLGRQLTSWRRSLRGSSRASESVPWKVGLRDEEVVSLFYFIDKPEAKSHSKVKVNVKSQKGKKDLASGLSHRVVHHIKVEHNEGHLVTLSHTHSIIPNLNSGLVPVD